VAGGAPAPAKPLFGGNVGRKPSNPDRPKPGTPEFKAWDAERKRREYHAKKAAAPLPATAPPPVESVEGAASAQSIAVDYGAAAPAVPWVADDLRDVCAQLVELGEGISVEQIARQCIEAKFPPAVVDKWKGRAAFPPSSKRSLSASLPGTLAKAFNAASVPVGLKSIITTVPALGIILMQQFQLRTELKKVIAEESRQVDREAKAENKTPGA